MAWKRKTKFKSESFPTLQLSILPTATAVPLALIIRERDDTQHDAAHLNTPPQLRMYVHIPARARKEQLNSLKQL